jgi:hypothetical protein
MLRCNIEQTTHVYRISHPQYHPNHNIYYVSLQLQRRVNVQIIQAWRVKLYEPFCDCDAWRHWSLRCDFVVCNASKQHDGSALKERFTNKEPAWLHRRSSRMSVSATLPPLAFAANDLMA